MCNFAPPDMVGHTGVYEAAVEAVSKTDEAVGVVWKAVEEANEAIKAKGDGEYSCVSTFELCLCAPVMIRLPHLGTGYNL